MKPFGIQEKEKRVKYVRALERFVKSAVAVLKRADFDFKLFMTRMEKNYKVLTRVEPVPLDSPYTSALENYVNTIFQTLKREEDPAEIHSFLLKEANQIEKLKTSNSYKKSKHKSSDFEDWE